MVKDEQIIAIGELLKNPNRPLKERFRALFSLKNLGGQAAVDAIAATFIDPSALLKHELAYCLGQMQDPAAIPILTKILEDKSQEPMVRHEAGEALGAIGDKSVIELLKKYSKDEVPEVSETCQLALARLEWLHSEQSKNESFKGTDQYTSVDPTPPSLNDNLDKLKETLLDNNASLFDRYRAMFSLRNINTPASAKILASGLTTGSALFRHEIGFVLGQMECSEVVNELAAVVRNAKESGMVRHEAAEALGAIASADAVAVLKEHLNDPVDVVRESCVVALDISDYQNSAEFQYADALSKVE